MIFIHAEGGDGENRSVAPSSAGTTVSVKRDADDFLGISLPGTGCRFDSQAIMPLMSRQRFEMYSGPVRAGHAQYRTSFKNDRRGGGYSMSYMAVVVWP